MRVERRMLRRWGAGFDFGGDWVWLLVVGGKVVVGSLICREEWRGKKRKSAKWGGTAERVLAVCGRDVVGAGSVAQGGSASGGAMIVEAALLAFGTL